MSAGKFSRKSKTRAQISSFRVINPSSSFGKKSCVFSKAAAKGISAISSVARKNSGPDERRSLSSRTPTARNIYPRKYKGGLCTHDVVGQGAAFLRLLQYRFAGLKERALKKRDIKKDSYYIIICECYRLDKGRQKRGISNKYKTCKKRNKCT